MKSPDHLTPDMARELLHYEPFSGRLIWRHRSVDWFENKRSCATWNGRYAGKPAGMTCRTTKGYKLLQIKVLGKTIAARRVAWMIHTGQTPPDQIGHRNQDATDIRWENLMEGSHKVIGRNRFISPLNKSGKTGVHWSEEKEKWVAQIKVDGQLIRLGRFDSFEDACEARSQAEKKHGFSHRHGRKRPEEPTE